MGRRAITTTTEIVERTKTIARTTAIETQTVWRTTHQDHYISIHPPPSTVTVTSYERTLTIPPSRETIYSPFPKSFEDLVYDNNQSIQSMQNIIYMFFGILAIILAMSIYLKRRSHKDSDMVRLKQC